MTAVHPSGFSFRHVFAAAFLFSAKGAADVILKNGEDIHAATSMLE